MTVLTCPCRKKYRWRRFGLRVPGHKCETMNRTGGVWSPGFRRCCEIVGTIVDTIFIFSILIFNIDFVGTDSEKSIESVREHRGLYESRNHRIRKAAGGKATWRAGRALRVDRGGEAAANEKRKKKSKTSGKKKKKKSGGGGRRNGDPTAAPAAAARSNGTGGAPLRHVEIGGPVTWRPRERPRDNGPSASGLRCDDTAADGDCDNNRILR